MPDRKQADRHYRSDQVPVGARIDKPDYDRLETARKRLDISRRQAVIAAIRDWLDRNEPETTETENR